MEFRPKEAVANVLALNHSAAASQSKAFASQYSFLQSFVSFSLR
jgi:hypothetical protein